MNESEPAPSTLDEARPPTDLRVADTDRWTEDRLFTPSPWPVGQLALLTPPAPIIAGPGLPAEAITPPAWWDISPPTGILPVSVIEPNPLPGYPVVITPVTVPIIVPWIPTIPLVPPISFPNNPLIPSTPSTSVPEPVLWVPVGLVLAAGALVRRRKH